MTFKSQNTAEKSTHQNQFKVTEESGLLKYLLLCMPGKSRNNVKSLLGYRQVSVNNHIETHFDFQVKPGDEVSLNKERAEEEVHCRGFRILHEDSSVVVIDKDAGLLTMATDTENFHTAYSILSRRVKRKNPDERIFIVHRLDRDTSGVMMFAKSENVQSILQRDWHQNVSERTYIAVVEGKVENKQGTIRSFLKENKALVMYSTRDPENGDEAITHYKVLKQNNDYSLLEIELETGRKNQIRVHMKDIGHCVVGDEKYGSKQNPLGRMGLHAKILAFQHPVTGKTVRFETPVPAKFARLFD
ncbi:MAG: RluA family pseudouridine synthase [Bacteroidota bacterium]